MARQGSWRDIALPAIYLSLTHYHPFLQFRSEPIYAPLSATIIADLPKIQAQPQAYFVKAPRRFQTDLPAWSCEYFSLRVHKPSSLKSANLKKPLSFPQPRTPSAEHLTPPRTLERRMIRSGLLPPETVTEVTASLPQKSKTYEMALTIFTSKKDVHRLASVRHVAAQRVRHTVRLLLQYGLRYDSGKKAYVTGPAGPHEWLLQGHSYIVRINLECFRMPQEKLLADMATGLRAVKVRAAWNCMCYCRSATANTFCPLHAGAWPTNGDGSGSSEATLRIRA